MAIFSAKYKANQELSDFQIVSEEYDLDSSFYRGKLIRR